MMNKVGFVIPVYRHGSTVASVVRSVLPYCLPVILVDDGNDEANAKQINEAAELSPLVAVVTRKKNGGKGAAMKDGVLKAAAMSLTHVFQMDADGQQDASAVPLFLDEAEKHPECIICGYPQYDETVPPARKKGREVSARYARFLIRLGTLPAGQDDAVKDVMCGFRIYPLKPYLCLIRRHAIIDSRMAYDADILVQLVWGAASPSPVVQNLPVSVTYPADGLSNFRMVRDNVRIALAFTRLSFCLLCRLPCLLLAKIRRQS